jgi:hypothetical protein
VAGPFVVGGHAQARDRTQKIIGIDIVADLTGGYRRPKKRLKGGSKPPIEVRGQRLEGRVSRV